MADDDYDSQLRPWLDSLRPDSVAGIPPLYVTAGLGGIAAVLVALTIVNAIGSGNRDIGLSVLAAVTVFLASLVSLELGRRLGAQT